MRPLGARLAPSSGGGVPAAPAKGVYAIAAEVGVRLHEAVGVDGGLGSPELLLGDEQALRTNQAGLAVPTEAAAASKKHLIVSGPT